MIFPGQSSKCILLLPRVLVYGTQLVIYWESKICRQPRSNLSDIPVLLSKTECAFGALSETLGSF